jgi:type IV pilus assembly protein PilA
MLMGIRNQKGFTLIELLVVVAIIAILAAIAIPNFLGMRVRAYNGAAETEAGNARISEETYQTDWEIYGDDLAKLKGVDANLATTAGVTFEVVAGSPTSYTVVTTHVTGNRIYTATVTGLVFSEK